MPDTHKQTKPENLTLGLGGAGCDTVARMIEEWSPLGRVVAVNSDETALARSPVPEKLLLAHPPGRDWEAPETRSWLEGLGRLLAGHRRLIIVAGLGGGTGTIAAPGIARMATDMGIYTLAAVTLPFRFEGRLKTARSALAALTRIADEVVTVDLHRFLANRPDHAPMSTTLYQAQRAMLVMVRASLSRLDSGG